MNRATSVFVAFAIPENYDNSRRLALFPESS